MTSLLRTLKSFPITSISVQCRSICQLPRKDTICLVSSLFYRSDGSCFRLNCGRDNRLRQATTARVVPLVMQKSFCSESTGKRWACFFPFSFSLILSSYFIPVLICSSSSYSCFPLIWFYWVSTWLESRVKSNSQFQLQSSSREVFPGSSSVTNSSILNRNCSSYLFSCYFKCLFLVFIIGIDWLSLWLYLLLLLWLLSLFNCIILDDDVHVL